MTTTTKAAAGTGTTAATGSPTTTGIAAGNGNGNGPGTAGATAAAAGPGTTAVPGTGNGTANGPTTGLPGTFGTEAAAGTAAATRTPAAAGTEATDPLRELRRLRRDGLLAAQWPRVPALLAELTDAGDREPEAVAGDLTRAGRVLAALDPDEVLTRHPGTPLVTVAVTGHSSTARLGDPLTAELARHGLLARTVTGDHGAWLRDLHDADGELRRCRPDLTLCLLDAGAVMDALPVPWTWQDVEAGLARLLERLTAAADAHAADAAGTLVLNTLVLPRTVLQQLVGRHERALLGAVWREFNARLLRLTADRPALAVVDLDPLVAEGGPATDPRLALYARAAYGEQLLAAYAREAAHVLRARHGLTRKCLVLDLDNTLWAGVLGDDGPEGITAAPGTLAGEPYAALQRTVRQLASQGVLLAVSSKNDEDAVRPVLRGHPDMQLREDDFAQVHAHWEPKDGSLRAIAAGLGIATDALVFADDSPAERALVRSRVPEAAVVPLGTEPALHVARLLADGWFDTPRVTGDDRARTERYRQAAARAGLERGSGSYEEYLHDLGVRLTLGRPRPHEAERIAQLSLRTNQFNLTGERLGADGVRAAAADPAGLVLAVHVADRFGDSGLAGAVLARYADDALHVDNFWLSCRVFARGVEQGVLAVLLAHAAERGLPAVVGRYRPTARNGRAAGFYPSAGFTPVAAAAGADGALCFRHDLAGLPAAPAHLTIDSDLGGDDEPARTNR
ncbi:HAD-IIIC family phosphatase [Streptomyces bambusae]|uniref:HAD-IIIC family phosphatase n=1 Tax=Streptomyces bambusae TaxID=1550616 RepID=A0ABS6ZDX6_9ACTN|nr:HAD-IIIC family phosphatase [Streptomyces bambusae]MBW5485967.1 HAD-IIIC family phosphatase [Streptomyces bambusae]